MAKPNNVRANMPMAKRMRIMVAIAPLKMTMSSAKFAVRALTIINFAMQTQPPVQ